MNIIINSECNKFCSYCFAKDHRSGENMSFEKFQELVEFSENPIKILGGEPTLHPDFLKMVQYACEQKGEVTVISNFLFSKEVLAGLLELSEKYAINFLINSTPHNSKEKYNRFVHNYTTLFARLYILEKEDSMSCGLTFAGESLESIALYIKKLKTDLLDIGRLRISLDFPGSQERKDKFYFLENHDTGDLFVGVIAVCIQLGIAVNIDCTYFPCMFSNRAKYKYAKKFATHTGSVGRCGGHMNSGGPTDVFSDGSASYCYPLKNTITADNITEKFKNFSEVRRYLGLKYAFTFGKTVLPLPCRKCSFLRDGKCLGPTLCFYDLENHTDE